MPRPQRFETISDLSGEKPSLYSAIVHFRMPLARHAVAAFGHVVLEESFDRPRTDRTFSVELSRAGSFKAALTTSLSSYSARPAHSSSRSPRRYDQLGLADRDRIRIGLDMNYIHTIYAKDMNG